MTEESLLETIKSMAYEIAVLRYPHQYCISDKQVQEIIDEFKEWYDNE